ncbi:MAG: SUMF1/EgtB/PvdO family nonheme iron enzyme [Planctomycetota bacterium]|nr:SUMF1/EgtB/PvdO family nonheme iron enzyme [Planctomycetota bacterium]
MNLANVMRRSASLLWGGGTATATEVTEDLSRHRVDKDQGYALILWKREDFRPDSASAADAWERLEEDMSFVIGGTVFLNCNNTASFVGSNRNPEVEETVVAPIYMDRYTVTNAEYLAFVQAGGYDMTSFWPDDIIPYLPQFTDTTGQPGPKFWQNGRPPAKKHNHPVVGINWYEAYAYARWVGKRLPTAAEWQWAASWAVGDTDPLGLKKFPWGNAFDARKANIWSSGHNDTVPADEYYDGCTPNGIYQLIGNVWEWVAAVFVCEEQHDDIQILFDHPMAEIRGGAFDTYFETQAACAFRTGQPILNRMHNVGFRCCLTADSLLSPPDSSTHTKD